MKAKNRKFLKKLGAGSLAAASIFAVMRVMGAQPILMGAPPEDTTPQAVDEDATNNEMSVFLPAADRRDNSLPQPFKAGPFVFRPHAYYHFSYGTGMQASPSNSVNTVVQEISAGLAIDLGRHWTFDYTPTFRIYSNGAFQNSVDHSASLVGNTAYEDWLFGFAQTFSRSDETITETATQTRETTFVTSLTAKHELNDHFILDLGVNQNFDYVSGLEHARDWSTMDGLDYVFNKHLTVGILGGGGYTCLDSSPDQSYERLQGNINWRATEKISLSFNAGGEYRQFMSPNYQNELNPTFGAALQYAPFKHTEISLSASRTVNSSDYYIIAQSTETTTVGLSINQRLLKDYFITGGIGFNQTQYTTALASIASDVRTDDTYSFNIRVGRTFLKRGNIALTYQYSDNHSSAAGYSYRSNQIGVEVGFAY